MQQWQRKVKCAGKGAHLTPKSVHVVERLPLTSVGEVDKQAIRAVYWEGMERMMNEVRSLKGSRKKWGERYRC